MSDTMKTLAVCASGAAIGFVAFGGNPLGAVAGCLVPMAMGCGGDETNAEIDNTPNECIDPQEASRNWSVFLPPVDKERPIYTNNGYQVVTDPEISKAAADFYLTKIPELENKVAEFFKITSPWRGNVTLALTHEEGRDERLIELRGRTNDGLVMISIPGREVESFNDLASRGEYLHEGIFLHEFSHALREHIADFSALLEEGLATYTQIHLRSDNEEILAPGESLTGIECDNAEYRIYADSRDENGNLEREYLDLPRGRSLDIFNVYAQGFCFWDTIRENYGHSAVQAIVQSMVEFSKAHENECNPYARFSFFETFMAATGMDEASARTYFDIFSTSTDDDRYPLGGVSWQK